MRFVQNSADFLLLTHMEKPFHLMTPEERTAYRIAQNKAIAAKVASVAAPAPRTRKAKAAAAEKSTPAPLRPEDYFRGTPEERAQVGGFIRKVQR